METQINEVVDFLRRAASAADGGLTDGQLLEDFLEPPGRGGPCSPGAAARPDGLGRLPPVLRNHHDAEDAFQATFLVLVRKAASIASQRDARQLALRRGPPDGVEGAGDGRQSGGRGRGR